MKTTICVLTMCFLMCACGSSTVRPEDRSVTVEELSPVDWTQVSEICYNDLIQTPRVVGYRDSGKFFLMLITHYE